VTLISDRLFPAKSRASLARTGIRKAAVHLGSLLTQILLLIILGQAENDNMDSHLASPGFRTVEIRLTRQMPLWDTLFFQKPVQKKGTLPWEP
jgi:hypothetical protein